MKYLELIKVMLLAIIAATMIYGTVLISDIHAYIGNDLSSETIVDILSGKLDGIESAILRAN
ncbi:hypothetical protein [Vibrio apostichopi]|uniref:hypothetical protein n=1 Tax=Vibrio apostichopi TaxID=3035453 RepID=UPI002572D15F|nr:hypothetical protein [Vibrio sp. FE10]